MTNVLSQTPIDLGDGLSLRMGRLEDADSLVDFNTRVFDERITGWTRDLISGGHPTVQPGDFTIVEDTRTKEIVSSLCLISQTWAYSGVPFPVGRAELVATNSEYRRRGLIRKQFEVLHALSAAKGELMQVIVGVEWFYRQFGYEMGIQLIGNRCVDSKRLSSMAALESEPLRLRPAAAADHAFIRELYGEVAQRQVYAAVRSPEQWDYEFIGRTQSNTRRREWLIIESAQGERVGYAQYLPCLASPQWLMFRVYQLELKPGVCYLNAAPVLLRLLWTKAQAMVAAGELPCAGLHGLEFALEREHPLFQALPRDGMREIKAGPWYCRVPDMTAFLNRVRRALEGHLKGTVAEGYSGELRLNFFRSGIRLEFERGRIKLVENWMPETVSSGDARFPGASFAHLVWGWRRFHQLAECYPDCSATDEAAV